MRMDGACDAGRSCRGNGAGDPSGPCRVHPGTRSKAPSGLPTNQPTASSLALFASNVKERHGYHFCTFSLQQHHKTHYYFYLKGTNTYCLFVPCTIWQEIVHNLYYRRGRNRRLPGDT